MKRAHLSLLVLTLSALACNLGAPAVTPSALEQPTETATQPTVQSDAVVTPTESENGEAPLSEMGSCPIYLRDQVGALYTPFPWAGPLRDPLKSDLQIQDVDHYVPMSAAALEELRGMLAERDVITQIGGMGSAKSGGSGNANFTNFMDSVLSDGGAGWRAAVEARALEVASVTPRNDALYWQIGNEIGAISYSENVHKYWNEGISPRPFDTTIIPTYVEYFFAPTVQALHQASAQARFPARVALGSINVFANPNARVFLDALLNYEIEGTMAPDLAGTRVAEHVDILTVHYFMNFSTVEQPKGWHSLLEGLRDTWVGVENIKGVWSTEEIGIKAAESGNGAGAALRIASRYMEWLHENCYSGDETRWFYYAPREGPEGQRANDSMTALWNLVGEEPIFYRHSQIGGNPLVETYVFQIPTRSAWLVTSGVIVDNDHSVTLSVLPTLPPFNLPNGVWSAIVYAQAGTTQVNVTIQTTASETTITFDHPITLARADTLMIWIAP